MLPTLPALPTDLLRDRPIRTARRARRLRPIAAEIVRERTLTAGQRAFVGGISWAPCVVEQKYPSRYRALGRRRTTHEMRAHPEQWFYDSALVSSARNGSMFFTTMTIVYTDRDDYRSSGVHDGHKPGVRWNP